MRRIRLGTGPAALFGAMLLAALVVFLPLRLALGWSGLDAIGLSAREVRGLVWDGRLVEARLGDLPLGDLHASLSPLRLLIGRARLALAGRGEAGLHGAVEVGRHLTRLDRVTATLMPGPMFGPLPVTTIDLDELSVRFTDGQCDEADGRVRATLPATAGIALPVISGTVRCDGGALLVPLAGQAGGEGVTLRIRGDGTYRADVTLVPSDPAAATRLQEAGFTQSGAGYRLSTEGHF